MGTPVARDASSQYSWSFVRSRSIQPSSWRFTRSWSIGVLPTRSPMPIAQAWTRCAPASSAHSEFCTPNPRSWCPCQSILASGLTSSTILQTNRIRFWTPFGVQNLIRFVCKIVDEVKPEAKIEWHGHQDRGFGVQNSLWALEAGAHRVHACAIGIGERVGNTPMDQLLVNLQLLGWIDRDLTKLHEYCELASRATGVPIPDNYPIVGKDAFRTGTGVHAAAIIKARKKGDEWLADRVYSGVPASMVGRRQTIEVGPMSGISNVQCWLEDHGIASRPEVVEAIFQRAKESDRILTDEEILSLVHGLTPATAAR